MPSKDNKPKKFSLKPIEKTMLDTLMQQQATMLSNFCSFVAIERLNITVTENTRFEINEDNSELTIIQQKETDAAS